MMKFQQTYIGDTPTTGTLVTVAKTSRNVPLNGIIRNKGSVNMILSTRQSNDNGASDAYAAINLRYNKASVASITIVPGGEAQFTIETQTKPYIAFDVSPSPGAVGVLELESEFGKLYTNNFVGAAF